jgi:hypothetical protein
VLQQERLVGDRHPPAADRLPQPGSGGVAAVVDHLGGQARVGPGDRPSGALVQVEQRREDVHLHDARSVVLPSCVVPGRCPGSRVDDPHRQPPRAAVDRRAQGGGQLRAECRRSRPVHDGAGPDYDRGGMAKTGTPSARLAAAAVAPSGLAPAGMGRPGRLPLRRRSDRPGTGRRGTADHWCGTRLGSEHRQPDYERRHEREHHHERQAFRRAQPPGVRRRALHRNYPEHSIPRLPALTLPAAAHAWPCLPLLDGFSNKRTDRA